MPVRLRGFGGHVRTLFFIAVAAPRFNRPVAPTARAAVSKTAGWGFESLLACQFQTGIYLSMFAGAF